jgi:hypothetical protein
MPYQLSGSIHSTVPVFASRTQGKRHGHFETPKSIVPSKEDQLQAIYDRTTNIHTRIGRSSGGLPKEGEEIAGYMMDCDIGDDFQSTDCDPACLSAHWLSL